MFECNYFFHELIWSILFISFSFCINDITTLNFRWGGDVSLFHREITIFNVQILYTSLARKDINK